MTVRFAGTDPVSEIVDELHSALLAALSGTAAGVPDRQEIGYGTQITFDLPEMCWTRVVQIYPSTLVFGAPDSTLVRHRPTFQWAVDVELAVIRCVAGIDVEANRPQLPTADQITADAATITEDARALRHACQYLQQWAENSLIRPWQPIGPSGNSAGGKIQVTIGFGDCRPTVT